MPKYLFQASYAEAGSKGLLKEGRSSRREAVEQAVKGLGGTFDHRPIRLQRLMVSRW